MGYAQEGSLTDMFPAGESLDRMGRRIVERVQEDMRDEVQRRTPVAEMPLAYLAVTRAGGRDGWIKDRKGRVPGTLRNSWMTAPIEVLPNGTIRGPVETEDPVARFVEDDTRPHAIRPKKPDGTLRFPQGQEFLYRKSVRHPGTEGVHMMRDTLAVTEAHWQETAEEVLAEDFTAAERTPLGVG